MNSKHKAIYISVLFLSVIAIYFPIIPDMYHLWMRDSNNSHGILVPFISLFLIWKNKGRINLDQAQQSNIGLVILIISLLFYIIGYAGGVEVLPRLTIVTTLIGLVIYNFGLKIFSNIFAFPLLFLFFMVPVPISIIGLVSFPLQLLVTKISAFIIGALSIPVIREGNMLYFVDTSLEVAEACSGIRSLIAFMTLGFLFAYLMNGSIKRRAIIIMSTFPLAFFANLLRVTGTGILAHFFGSRVARGFLHEFSGIVIFAFGFVLLFALYYFLEKTQKIQQTK